MLIASSKCAKKQSSLKRNPKHFVCCSTQSNQHCYLRLKRYFLFASLFLRKFLLVLYYNKFLSMCNWYIIHDSIMMIQILSKDGKKDSSITFCSNTEAISFQFCDDRYLIRIKDYAIFKSIRTQNWILFCIIQKQSTLVGTHSKILGEEP